jgi:hypothetical protein
VVQLDVEVLGLAEGAGELIGPLLKNMQVIVFKTLLRRFFDTFSQFYVACTLISLPSTGRLVTMLFKIANFCRKVRKSLKFEIITSTPRNTVGTNFYELDNIQLDNVTLDNFEPKNYMTKLQYFPLKPIPWQDLNPNLLLPSHIRWPMLSIVKAIVIQTYVLFCLHSNKMN